MPRKKKRVKKWKLARKNEYERNIHITFNANEKSRITDPILDEEPDEIYVFLYYNPETNTEDQNMEFFQANKEVIQKELPDTQIFTQKVNFVDYVDVVRKLTDVIYTKENIDNKTRVTINLLGAKMSAIAVVELTRIWYRLYQKSESINLFPRYIYSKDFQEERSEGAHVGKMICVEFPNHSVILPDLDLLQVLYLYEYKRNNDQFGHEREWVRRKDLEDIIQDSILREEIGDENPRQKMDLKFIRPLKNLGLITKQKKGGDYRIYLTKEGKKYVNLVLLFLKPMFEREGLVEWIDPIKKSLYKIQDTELEENKSQNKVHIVFNKKEEKRITDPILEERPDIVHYFDFKQGRRKDKYPGYMEKNLALIQTQLPECEIIKDSLSYVNYFKIVSNIARIIKFCIDKDEPILISINLGTGSKLLAIAVISAYRYWFKLLEMNTKVRLNIIYPYGPNYNPERDGATHTGDMEMSYLPDLEIKPPKKELIQAILLIYEIFTTNPSKMNNRTFLQPELEEEMYENEILSIDEKSCKKDSKKSAKSVNLNNKIIKPMLNWKFLERGDKEGRMNRFYATDNWEDVYNVFRFFKDILIES